MSGYFRNRTLENETKNRGCHNGEALTAGKNH